MIRYIYKELRQEENEGGGATLSASDIFGSGETVKQEMSAEDIFAQPVQEEGEISASDIFPEDAVDPSVFQQPSLIDISPDAIPVSHQNEFLAAQVQQSIQRHNKAYHEAEIKNIDMTLGGASTLKPDEIQLLNEDITGQGDVTGFRTVISAGEQTTDKAGYTAEVRGLYDSIYNKGIIGKTSEFLNSAAQSFLLNFVDFTKDRSENALNNLHDKYGVNFGDDAGQTANKLANQYDNQRGLASFAGSLVGYNLPIGMTIKGVHSSIAKLRPDLANKFLMTQTASNRFITGALESLPADVADAFNTAVDREGNFNNDAFMESMLTGMGLGGSLNAFIGGGLRSVSEAGAIMDEINLKGVTREEIIKDIQEQMVDGSAADIRGTIREVDRVTKQANVNVANEVKSLNNEAESMVDGMQRGTVEVVDETGRNNDISGFDMLFSTPENAMFRYLEKEGNSIEQIFNHPAYNQATRNIEAQLKMDYEIGKDRMVFRDIEQNLGITSWDRVKGKFKTDKTQSARLRQAVKDLDEGKDISDPKLFKAAETVRTYYDNMRVEIQENKRMGMRKYYAKKRQGLFNNVLDDALEFGDDIESLYISRVLSKRVDKRLNAQDFKRIEELESVVQDFKDVDNWGRDQYITNAARGNHKVQIGLKDGTRETIAVGPTKTIAINRMNEVLKDRPDVREVFYTTDINFANTNPDRIALDADTYKAMRGKLFNSVSNVIEEDAQEFASKIINPLIKVKPEVKHTFAGQLKRRRSDTFNSQEDMLDALHAYSSSIRKKLNVDPQVDDWNYTLEQSRLPNSTIRITENMEKMVTSQLEDLRGSYGIGDQRVDRLVEAMRGSATDLVNGAYKKLGVDKAVDLTGGRGLNYSRAVNKVRGTNANLKLGYKPVGGMVNWANAHYHNVIKNGYTEFHEAGKLAKTAEGKKLLAENEPYLGALESVDGFTPLSINDQKTLKDIIYQSAKPTGLFTMGEPAVRRRAFLASYLTAKNSLGMSESSAVQFARRGVRVQSFIYTSAAMPQWMRSTSAKLITQFKPYLINEIDFMRSLSRVELTQYLSGMVAVGGPAVLLRMIESVPVLGILGITFLEELEEMGNSQLGKAFYGVTGLGGDINISQQIAPQIGSGWEAQLGPILGELNKFVNNVVLPTSEGGLFLGDRVEKWLTSLSPQAKRLSNIMAVDDDGWLVDQKNNRLYNLGTEWEKFLHLSGVESVDVTRERTANFLAIKQNKREQLNRSDLINKMVRETVETGNFPTQLVQQYIDNRGTEDGLESGLNSAYQRRNITPSVRRLINASALTKVRELERTRNIFSSEHPRVETGAGKSF